MNGVRPAQSSLNHPELVTILFAIMVKRLGGKVTVTQADIDDIAFSKFEEDGYSDGTLEFRMVPRALAS